MKSEFGPALGVIEFSSLASGYAAMDVVVKKAPVRILEGSMMTPGKFFLLFNGDEASVESSFNAISDDPSWPIVDKVLIPQIEAQVLPGLYGLLKVGVQESLCIVETASMSAGLLCCDEILKSTQTQLIDFRSSRGIGGKSVFFVTGSLDSVQAAEELAGATLKARGTLLNTEVIARPHEDFLKYFNIDGSA